MSEHLPHDERSPTAVIPAKAGIHLCSLHQSQMDSSVLKAEHIHVLSPRARFRGNDGNESPESDRKEEYLALQIIGRLLLITKPIWS